jgi:hypothetical protein
MRNERKHLELVARRHPEWREHQLRWRWLLDSYEGGNRYRQAVYGYDPRGLPIRNLIRHKREYPDPRETASSMIDLTGNTTEPGTMSTDDDYELRRARTPVPAFVSEAIEAQLSRIYSREVRRTGPRAVQRWWSDVDGCGTPVDHWMSETVAPLLLLLGQVDILVDHPATPPGESIETHADVERLGLDRIIARTILPHDVVWWKLDHSGCSYQECLIRETVESEKGPVERYRHWTSTRSTLYGVDGDLIESQTHAYGRVPIVRVFDKRKARCRNIGQSRLEAIAERQREYYNRDSELILSDTTQAHPLLQGPEDFVQADGTIPIGPSWLLPKKKNSLGGSATYEGFDVVAFPKEGAESIRRNKADLREEVDRDAAIVRPTGREAAPLSGLAKLIDHAEANTRLCKVGRMLARAEATIAGLVQSIINAEESSVAEGDRIEVVYPAEFDFYSAADVAAVTGELQKLLVAAGALPVTESLLLTRLVRLCLPGQSDAQYAECDQEIEKYLKNVKKRPLGGGPSLHANSLSSAHYVDVQP